MSNLSRKNVIFRGKGIIEVHSRVALFQFIAMAVQGKPVAVVLVWEVV